MLDIKRGNPSEKDAESVHINGVKSNVVDVQVCHQVEVGRSQAKQGLWDDEDMSSMIGPHSDVEGVDINGVEFISVQLIC